jgi:homoserine O-acetyltransferase/O-succinyltransferase
MAEPLKSLQFDQALPLDGGGALSPFTIAYETWGTLNAARSNAILICHALTGDQFAATANPVTGRPAWWPEVVGPGRAVDTERYFVICANVLGGCMGTTGPASFAPDGAPWALRFPVITVADMVRAQAMLVDALGIETLFAVIGGSMGGMQVLEWIASRPDGCAVRCPLPPPRGIRRKTSHFMKSVAKP